MRIFLDVLIRVLKALKSQEKNQVFPDWCVALR